MTETLSHVHLNSTALYEALSLTKGPLKSKAEIALLRICE